MEYSPAVGTKENKIGRNKRGNKRNLIISWLIYYRNKVDKPRRKSFTY